LAGEKFGRSLIGRTLAGLEQPPDVGQDTISLDLGPAVAEPEGVRA
jgi:hypothetical protein